MLLVYENRDKGISVEWKRVVHMPPHLHEAIESCLLYTSSDREGKENRERLFYHGKTC